MAVVLPFGHQGEPSIERLSSLVRPDLQRVNDLIVSLTDDVGITTFTITHDMASALKIAHRVAMLYQGKIIWIGPRERLFDSGNPYVDQFVQGRAEGPIR